MDPSVHLECDSAKGCRRKLVVGLPVLPSVYGDSCQNERPRWAPRPPAKRDFAGNLQR